MLQVLLVRNLDRLFRIRPDVLGGQVDLPFTFLLPLDLLSIDDGVRLLAEELLHLFLLAVPIFGHVLDVCLDGVLCGSALSHHERTGL